MNTALSKAFAATGKKEYSILAEENMKAVLEKFNTGEEGFYHTYKNGNAKYPAFLDDYAYLIQSLIHLQEITSDTNWLIKAKELTEFVKENFEETSTGYFFFTSRHQTDVIVRKKEIYDGATPSGNSVMVFNLSYLSIVFNKPEWMEQTVKNLSSVLQAVTRYPTSFGVWAASVFDHVIGINEIAIMGNNFAVMRNEFKTHFQPNAVLQSSLHENPGFPLLAGRGTNGKPQLFLCKNYTCQRPLSSVNSLVEFLVKSHSGRAQ